jgi:hypothetical protein
MSFTRGRVVTIRAACIKGKIVQGLVGIKPCTSRVKIAGLGI